MRCLLVVLSLSLYPITAIGQQARSFHFRCSGSTETAQKIFTDALLRADQKAQVGFHEGLVKVRSYGSSTDSLRLVETLQASGFLGCIALDRKEPSLIRSEQFTTQSDVIGNGTTNERRVVIMER